MRLGTLAILLLAFTCACSSTNAASSSSSSIDGEELLAIETASHSDYAAKFRSLYAKHARPSEITYTVESDQDWEHDIAVAGDPVTYCSDEYMVTISSDETMQSLDLVVDPLIPRAVQDETGDVDVTPAPTPTPCFKGAAPATPDPSR